MGRNVWKESRNTELPANQMAELVWCDHRGRLDVLLKELKGHGKAVEFPAAIPATATQTKGWITEWS